MEDTAAKLHFATLLGMPPQLMYPFMFPPPAGCTFYRTPTSSPSPSPPGSPNPSGSVSPTRHTKSFTIDAILGLRQPTTYSSSASTPCGGPTQLSASQHSMVAAREDEEVIGRKEKLGGQTRRVGRPKRVRTIFTTEQLESMERAFRLQQYMVGKQRCQLAHTLNLHENQVKVWFQNRRIKWRRQNLEQEQARLSQISHGQSTPQGPVQTRVSQSPQKPPVATETGLPLQSGRPSTATLLPTES